MLEDMRRGNNASAYQGNRAQPDMGKLRLDQHPPRVLGAPPQAYPPGPVCSLDLWQLAIVVYVI